jgi:two-component system sensor histidine kinase KdpD
LNRLVENLLDMTRLEAGAIRLQSEPGDIQDLVGTVLNQASDRLGKHPVHIDIPPDLPLVCMDAVLVGQVLVNLVDNANKYSPPDSPIHITVKQVEDELRVSVRDYGIGIPNEDLERIFTKFYRVQHSNQTVGTGLGLSISKGLVEAHGGRIWAQNNPDQGVTVTFTLPLQP